jgi:hypothetical protein
MEKIEPKRINQQKKKKKKKKKSTEAKWQRALEFMELLGCDPSPVGWLVCGAGVLE